MNHLNMILKFIVIVAERFHYVTVL